MNQDWKTQAALLSEQAKMKKQQEFQQKFMQLRNDEMKFQQTIKKQVQIVDGTKDTKPAKIKIPDIGQLFS